MTDKPTPLPAIAAVASQTIGVQDPVIKDEISHEVEPVEEEPYTIKCICNFSDDDGNTIYCETCDTWQHIDCFYPNNREEAIREDFAHSCAECQPRSLDRQKAIERILRLRNAVIQEVDKKPKRPPSKSHKKKPRPNELQINAHPGSTMETGKHTSPSENHPPAKKAKTSHRPSQSISSHPSKRSPPYNNPRTSTAHPPSPATTPPDLPDDFLIHHYSAGFHSLYDEHEVPDAHNNTYASLKIPTALTTWVRHPETMKQEVGHTPSEVFQKGLDKLEHKPTLEVKDATRSLELGPTLRWRFLTTTSPIQKDVPLIELNGEIGFQKDYCADPDNLWADLSSPLPFVFFHPVLPLYIDTRKEGSRARYIRRSCKPNAQLDTYLSEDTVYHFWLVSDRHIGVDEQITLPWDFRLDKTVCPRWLHLLGLREDETPGHDDFEMEASEYTSISNWIDRILSEYGGCACDLDNNCAFARFHRRYLHGRTHGRVTNGKKRQRKPRMHTISPTSTGHATNSRAASEGNGDDNTDHDGRDDSGSSRSKPPSRDRTPHRQGSLDQPGILTEPTDRDKRKVAMVEDSFRRMEQQQQPPRKKKRISDGTATSSSSTKTKARTGSAASQANNTEPVQARSQSGSPASRHSPQLPDGTDSLVQAQESRSSRSRQTSSVPRPAYCDAAVQTDPVDGQWFSDPSRSPRPRKKIVRLAVRLLNSRYRDRPHEDKLQLHSEATQVSTSTTMDIDHPAFNDDKLAEIGALKDAVGSTTYEMEQSSPIDTAPGPPMLNGNDSTQLTATKGTALRVQLPPVPTFDNTGLNPPSATTPQSTSSTIAHSPFSNTTNSPFVPSVGMMVTQPSPVKKKLSLSDYTKSRLNKGSGKVAGGNAILKSSISNPDDIKIDAIMESPSTEKPEDEYSAPATAAA
ncbi:hypothetical protein S40285_05713 [Stachybotrys chlorohalonatus IBT 40285]|uniref:SET domain-containing protein n=1 Tax=Stachybotrys chlorohalonatus (strain IBT 40285) TaxID=1283841 RepID=A0A084QJ37_STAC4|nr:hypothetical protein S40285_05713 [Stachybotrys chlorohalonata IBT 40285]